jgi:hypothetical protein
MAEGRVARKDTMTKQTAYAHAAEEGRRRWDWCDEQDKRITEVQGDGDDAFEVLFKWSLSLRLRLVPSRRSSLPFPLPYRSHSHRHQDP